MVLAKPTPFSQLAVTVNPVLVPEDSGLNLSSVIRDGIKLHEGMGYDCVSNMNVCPNNVLICTVLAYSVRYDTIPSETVRNETVRLMMCRVKEDDSLVFKSNESKVYHREL